ncbi:MAG TPA: hypothetical protein VFL30_10710 [Rhodanobacteraceae bacterium]|nr:hypothetical protein [Rhodanobacteraceae bacterium]
MKCATPVPPAQVVIDRVVSNIRTSDASAAMAPETLRALVAAVLSAVREMLDHDRRVHTETSVCNGYVDRLDRGSA